LDGLAGVLGSEAFLATGLDSLTACGLAEDFLMTVVFFVGAAAFLVDAPDFTVLVLLVALDFAGDFLEPAIG
jgi:hypothetical protein